MNDLFFKVGEVIFSRLTRNASIVFVGNTLFAVFGIAFTVLVARFLGPENWGLLAALLSFMTILSAIGDLGLTAGLFRFISKKWTGDSQGAQRLLNEIFSLRVITALLIALLLVAFAPLISQNIFKTSDITLLIIASIGTFCFLLLDFQITSLQARQSWKIASFFLAFTNLLRVILILLLFYFDNLSIINTLLVFSFSPLFSFFLSLFWQRVGFVFGDLRATIFKVAPFTGWMSINRIFGAVSSRVDVLLLLQLATPTETGIFAAARQLSQGIPIALGSFATVLAPQFAELKGRNLRSVLSQAVQLSILISFGIFVGIFLSAPAISLFGEKYRQSVPVLQWLLVSFIPFALSTPFVNALIYSIGRPKIIAMLSVIQLPVVVFGNILLIPKIGIFSPVVILGLLNLSTLLVTGIFTWLHFRRKE